MSKYGNMTKAALIEELRALRAGLGVDIDGIEAGLVLLDDVIRAISTTNVVNYGLKPQVHNRWKQDLASAQRALHEAAALRPVKAESAV